MQPGQRAITWYRVSKKAWAVPGRDAPSNAASSLGNSLRRLARLGGRWFGGAGTLGASGLGRLFVTSGLESPGPTGTLAVSGSSLESVKCTASGSECCVAGLDCVRREVCGAGESWRGSSVPRMSRNLSATSLASVAPRRQLPGGTASRVSSRTAAATARRCVTPICRRVNAAFAID